MGLRRPPFRLAAAAVVLVALAAGFAHAQGFRFREGSIGPRYAPPDHMPDGAFVVCRLQYKSVRYEAMGIGWITDYPYAEINLSTRLSELTKTRVSHGTDGHPNSYVV